MHQLYMPEMHKIFKRYPELETRMRVNQYDLVKSINVIRQGLHPSFGPTLHTELKHTPLYPLVHKDLQDTKLKDEQYYGNLWDKLLETNKLEEELMNILGDHLVTQRAGLSIPTFRLEEGRRLVIKVYLAHRELEDDLLKAFQWYNPMEETLVSHPRGISVLRH